MKKSNLILTLVICFLMVLVIRAAVSDVSGKWELNMSSDHGDFSIEANTMEGEVEIMGMSIAWSAKRID